MRAVSSDQAASHDPDHRHFGSGPLATTAYPDARRAPVSRSTTLVDRARDGDRDAFEALIGPRIEPAFRTAVSILGSEADARDATQDALLDAWRGIRRLRDPDRFDAWLSRIVVNACRSIGRRRGRAKVREIPIAALMPNDDPPSRDIPMEDDAARLDELERAFNRLTVAQRSLLVLHHLEHRSIGELAEIQGVPEGTVKWRLHAAREALERSLAEERR